MDKVRFGRALGYGARHAAKAISQAVDAATTPAAPDISQPSTNRTQTIAHTAANLRQHTASAAKHLTRSVGAPLKKFTSVLWLQVTGTFFTVLALFLITPIWRLHTALPATPNSPAAHKLYLLSTIFLIFAYFALSNFLHAYRRDRR